MLKRTNTLMNKGGIKMVQIIEDSEIEDIIFKDNYILIMCKELSSIVIKKLARKQNRVGIYYRNGYVLDTVNGVLSKIDKKENLSYELNIYPLQENMLKGITEYEVFYDFIKMREYFLDYYKIILYWNEHKDKCVYEKTTPLDKFGGWGTDTAFKPIRQINVNTKIFEKIKFVPNLQETLNSFVDETTISQFYKD